MFTIYIFQFGKIYSNHISVECSRNQFQDRWLVLVSPLRGMIIVLLIKFLSQSDLSFFCS